MLLKRVLYAHPAFGLAIQVQHVLIQILMAGLGAVGTYFLNKPTTSLIEALSSWTTAKPILLGALGVFLVTVVAQAQQSFLSGGTVTPAQKQTPPFPGDSGPIPPTAQRTYRPQRLWPTMTAALLLVCVAIPVTTLFLSGCQTLPAVVTDLADISKIVIADAQAGMNAEQIIADVVAKTGVQDFNLIAQIIETLLADQKTPASVRAVLQQAATSAHAKAAQQATK